VQIYTPEGYFKEFKEKGIPTDFPFSIKPSELDLKIGAPRLSWI
jgi:hypothetical protein